MPGFPSSLCSVSPTAKRESHPFSTTRARALTILTATGLWATGAEEQPAAAADKKYVTDPTTGEVVGAPQYGGSLTFATMLEPPSADTGVYGSAGLAIAGVAERLLIPNWAVDRDEYAFSSQYIPAEFAAGQLAESWEQPDPLTYVFQIRQGVHWHDKPPMNGRELTADDIEYNYHRILGLGSGFTEGLPYSQLAGIGIESVTATDKWTVVFKLKEPRLAALQMIMVAYMSFMLPPEVIEQHGDISDWRNFVGTGPYELTDWVQGTSITHTKNPDYWGFDEKYPQNRLPYIDKLVAFSSWRKRHVWRDCAPVGSISWVFLLGSLISCRSTCLIVSGRPILKSC